MMVFFQQLDALCLFVTFMCVLFLLAEDRLYQENMFLRVMVGLWGLANFAQALWLSGVWQPSRTGYPWPRILLDTLLVVICIYRVAMVAAMMRRDHGYRVLHSI